MVVTYSVTLNTINMALIKCTECGEMISDKATVCPHCGAPIEKMTKCEDCGANILLMLKCVQIVDVQIP